MGEEGGGADVKVWKFRDEGLTKIKQVLTLRKGSPNFNHFVITLQLNASKGKIN